MSAVPPILLRVLVADDNPDIRTLFGSLLPRRGWEVVTVSSGEEAIEQLARDAFDLVVTDLKMGGAADGLKVLEAASLLPPPPLVIIMTGYASLETATGAIRGGAFDYVTKPFTLAEIDLHLDKVVDHLRLRRENNQLAEELADAYALIADLRARLEGAAPLPDVVTDARPAATEPPAEGAGTTTSEDGASAYRRVAWAPQRAADRLRTLFEQGALSRSDYDRLKGLIPQGPTVA